MHDMKYLFGGPKNSFALKNLTKIIIMRCEILVVFSTSILRCLSKLVDLRIEECKELKHIIEDDLQNQNMLNSFPKLKVLVVVKCCKLKYVFPVSICKEFLELEVLIIREANELEEIFKSEGDQKVKIPKLNFVVFDKLPSLFFTQGIQFQTAKNRFIQNCQKLSLASACAPYDMDEVYYFFIVNKDDETFEVCQSLFRQLLAESNGRDSGNENPSAETTKDFVAVGIEVEAALQFSSSQIQMKQTPEVEHEFVENDPDLEIPPVAILPTNSIELVNEQSTSQQCLMNQQHPLGEFDTTVKPSRENNCVEEGTALTNVNTITLSTHLELASSSKEQDVDVKDSLGTTKTNDDQVSLNDDVVVKVTSTIEEQFPKDDEFRVSKSKPSPSNSIPLPLAFQTPSMPSKGNPSQIVKYLSSPSLVTWELEELVSKKHLDYKNLSLLTDFLVKYPSVLLRDTSLSNRYKGYAYNCLAELLKFLQTNSVLDVLGSSQDEFVELLQDVRKCAFDKDWLDGVEKRALFPDLQFSQDVFQNLLDSKKQVTKDVEVMRLKIDILAQQMEDFNHQLTSSEAVLESIIQQEAQILETKEILIAFTGLSGSIVLGNVWPLKLI
ncbi:uncharacterized protein [Cicer arietinum]